MVEDKGETKNLAGMDEQRCGKGVGMMQEDMVTEMGDAIQEAMSGKAEGSGVDDLSAGDIAKMCALGYMSGPACGE